MPWAALSVWGFADAPVSWGLREHGHDHRGSENDYSVIVLPAAAEGAGVRFALLLARGEQ